MQQTRFGFTILAALGPALLLAGCLGSSGGITPSAVAPGAQMWRARNAADAAGGQFAYISDWITGNIDAYAIDVKTGALRSLKLKVSVPSGGPQPVAIEPTGKFAYVADASASVVYAYAIDATSGKLKPVPGSPFATGTAPDGVTTDPSGKFVYVANLGSDNVYAYAINSGNGALTTVKGSPFMVKGAALWVGVDPKGKFAYVPHYDASGQGEVAAFTINPSTGALSPIKGSPFAAGTTPSWMTVDPNGKFAYVTNLASNDISAYAIDATSGALKPVPNSPFKAGGEPYAVIVDATGKFLYAVNLASFNVSGYAIDAASGALTPVPGSPFAAGLSPENVAVDTTSSFVYVANYGGPYFSPGNVIAYAIDKSTGALKRVKGPVPAGGHYSGVATCKRVGSTCKPPLPL